jgi:hypothetical protein
LVRIAISPANPQNFRPANEGDKLADMNKLFAWMPGPFELLILGSMIAIPVGAIAAIIWLLRKK